MAEADGTGWVAPQSTRWGADVKLVGDDVFVTNSERLSKGHRLGVANSIS